MTALDPARLLHLLSIAEHGSFTRAAAAIGLSQPALSISMSGLEKSLGIRVIDRNRRGATLTDFGLLLANHAASLNSVLGRASEEVKLKKNGLEGSLVVGASPVGCVDIVPNAIISLKREAPDVSVRIREQPDDELIDALRTGAIDVVISPAGLRPDPPDILREVLMRDAFLVVMRRSHPLAKRKTLSLSELRSAEWVMPHAHTTMWRQIEALFIAENELWPVNLIETNSMTALKSLLIGSDTVSISSRSLVEYECRAGSLVCIPLRNPHFTREICLRRRTTAQPTPVLERFLRIVRDLGSRRPRPPTRGRRQTTASKRSVEGHAR